MENRTQVRRLIRAEMVRVGITFRELTARTGIRGLESSVRRGSLSAARMLAIFEALGLQLKVQAKKEGER